MDSIVLKTKELLTYHYGCHSNPVTIATRYAADADHPKKGSMYVADAYYPKKGSYQI